MVVHHPQIREALPASLARRALGPGDPAYRSVSSTYLRGGRPALVLRPTSVAEVVEAVAFAREYRALPLGIRSGGHGISGRSTNRGGLVIDVSALDGVEVLDEAARRVRIGPGATWKQVSAVLHEHGWAIGSGDYGGVGVGGLATAGGIGYLGRRFGLTIDHVRAVELVLADGSTMRASDDENPDLFWAVRGAGANFGVATSFELEADELGPVGWAHLTLTTSDLAGSLTRFGQLATAAPRDTTAFLVAGRPHGTETHLALYAVVADPEPDVIVERLTPFLDLGTVVRQQVVVTPYRDIMQLAPDVGPDGHHGFGEPSSRSSFLPILDGDTAQRIEAMLATGQIFFLQLRTMGGAISDVPPDRTAFAHRSPAFQLTGLGTPDLDAAWALVEPVSDGLYLSFETRTGPEQIRAAFPGATLSRLIALKHQHDPENLFRDNFNVLVTEADPDQETQP
ncbi:FAD-binding oxidoreductase [Aeromicrobium wangtongii]|uniref:FAD-dependent oxidoreductase n=1 Tax=Aeromicrobium wangtongii TaxID=2969247 RepID=A0ABY5MAR8_9ACTN|nr:FAD-dependent oxidoreductase [Aeromicrobium wangtongii]MCD9199103.1 FAD-dependent oxidoreductase [Aeromicrobium wangtongii]UUP12866.1 FAD-dependent oxidoreductase [Aeromicrobium wangtongii]